MDLWRCANRSDSRTVGAMRLLIIRLLGSALLIWWAVWLDSKIGMTVLLSLLVIFAELVNESFVRIASRLDR
jgi:hypothetical protein